MAPNPRLPSVSTWQLRGANSTPHKVHQFDNVYVHLDSIGYSRPSVGCTIKAPFLFLVFGQWQGCTAARRTRLLTRLRGRPRPGTPFRRGHPRISVCRRCSTAVDLIVRGFLPLKGLPSLRVIVSFSTQCFVFGRFKPVQYIWVRNYGLGVYCFWHPNNPQIHIYSAFSTVFSPQRGVTHFRVAQLLEDNVWYNWTVGESTATPVNLTYVTLMPLSTAALVWPKAHLS
jgi:hypothetical protein